MTDKVLQLKKINAAYLAAYSLGACPMSDKAQWVDDNFFTDLNLPQIEEALAENNFKSPDTLINEMIELITKL